MSIVGSFAEGGRQTLEWFERRLITVFGGGDPAEQTAVSLLLAVVAWTSTVVTLGVSIILAVIFTITFFHGVYRIWTEGPGGDD